MTASPVTGGVTQRGSFFFGLDLLCVDMRLPVQFTLTVAWIPPTVVALSLFFLLPYMSSSHWYALHPHPFFEFLLSFFIIFDSAPLRFGVFGEYSSVLTCCSAPDVDKNGREFVASHLARDTPFPVESPFSGKAPHDLVRNPCLCGLTGSGWKDSPLALKSRGLGRDGE